MSHLRNGLPQPINDWPVEGGKLAELLPEPENCNLLALGRSTGVVSLYEVSAGDCFHYIGHVDTMAEGIWVDTEVDEEGEEARTIDKSRVGEEDDAWPPFRRVGHHQYNHCERHSRRRAIHYLSLLVDEGREELTLMVGGGAGNLSVWSTSSSTIDPAGKVVRVNFMADCEKKFIWEGASDLKVSSTYPNGKSLQCFFH